MQLSKEKEFDAHSMTSFVNSDADTDDAHLGTQSKRMYKK